ncbi:hypothetical protein [Sphingosinicella rhizophila]|uniref:Transmembrane protein n=1 Tax=Sphingosinicella rhizophila TaxID=3050082 RepID=A0ABU3QBP9_9SPHN|nr:hypothetical protein [Sphingosinicella sp. GR2756]MDT9600830.1 hypothetical protein [Sphingosinicella sp. GR2756]
MSFREKFAWLMVAVLVATGIQYAVTVYQVSEANGAIAPPATLLLALWVMLVVAASMLAYGVAGLVSRKEWQVPVDEREWLVRQRAGALSGTVLGIAILAALGTFILCPDGNMLFHLVIGGLLVSQIAKFALQIFYIRRGL